MTDFIVREILTVYLITCDSIEIKQKSAYSDICTYYFDLLSSLIYLLEQILLINC